ncbi:MAG: hypothetical protein JWL62_2875 [Hyphomicrobiales bacterium]|nr:hypothetical protein [Hyphomicrobiales bacterium]
MGPWQVLVRNVAAALFLALVSHSAQAVAGDISASLRVGVTIVNGAQAKQSLSRVTTRLQTRNTQVGQVARDAVPNAPTLSTISLIYK